MDSSSTESLKAESQKVNRSIEMLENNQYPDFQNASDRNLEGYYKSVFENTGTAMLIIDADTTILQYNKKLQQITGFIPREIENKHKWTEFVDENDLPKMLEYHYKRRIDPSSVPSEYRFSLIDAKGMRHEMLACIALLPFTERTLVSLFDLTSYHQTEIALVESERKYRDLWENSSDIFYTTDIRGNFTSANAMALKTFGYSREDFSKISINQIVDPEYIDIAKKHMEDKFTLRSKSTTFELLTRTSQGTPVWVEVNTRLIIENDEITGIQGMARDITDRKIQEEKLRESQRRFKETADLLPGIICEMDSRLYLTYVNEMGLRLFGYTREEFEKGVCVRDLVPDEYKEMLQSTVKIIFSGGTSSPTVYSLYKKDGTLIHALLSSAAIVNGGKICGIRTCFFDISDRIRAEEKLRLSEERFRSIYSESPIGIALFSPDGFLFDMNRSFRRLFGFDETGSVHLELFEMLNLDSAELARLRIGKPVNCEIEKVFNCGSGNVRKFFDWYITPICTDSNKPSVYLAQVQDCTDRKEAQESRLRVEREATARAEALVEGLKRELREKERFHNMVSRSSQMKQIFDSIPQIAEAMVTVLIRGDSGTGKELIARSLHELSNRKEMPFVAINCSALPDNLLESELFGYKAGAFTDAKKDKPGKFTLAEGGTIFLDEIGDISPAMQVKLLRVLQERTFEPLGGIKPFKADVRIIAATNKSLETMVRTGEFREDLYYRINVVSIKLPALKERLCDIPILCEHFVERFNARYSKSIKGVSDEALETLLAYD
ncbi:MAG: sigma 54-interacting transcriptional regulator, partial [Fibrobacter sp.]|nr:sigma 54-interacting transcriptional regulator [Fibrobacter sp.]